MIRSLSLFAAFLAIGLFINFGEVQVVHAQGGGIVTCGHEISGNRFVYDCGTCELIAMANSVIDFIIRFMLVFTAILFAIAGYWLVTSRGNPGEYNRAKNLLTNIIIGLIIMLCSWLMIDTVMRVMANGGNVQYSPGMFMPWTTIQCTTNVPTDDGAITEPGISEGWLDDQTWRRYLTATELNATRLSSSEIAAMSGAVNGSTYNEQLCNIARAQGLGAYCDVLIAQMYVESRANPNAVSPAGAVGLMQLLPSTAQGLDPNGPLQGMSDAEVTQYLIANPEYNMTLGVMYFGEGLQTTNGNIQNTLAYYNGGPRALNDSQTCPGQTWWQCEANSGYAETRNYVDNILGLAGGVQEPGAPNIGAQ